MPEIESVQLTLNKIANFNLRFPDIRPYNARVAVTVSFSADEASQFLSYRTGCALFGSDAGEVAAGAPDEVGPLFSFPDLQVTTDGLDAELTKEVVFEATVAAHVLNEDPGGHTREVEVPTGGVIEVPWIPGLRIPELTVERVFIANQDEIFARAYLYPLPASATSPVVVITV